jgi:GMP synthase-like glutamine amidotransferase
MEPEVRTYLWQASYTAEQYLDLLRTHSDHIAMLPEDGVRLFSTEACPVVGRPEGGRRPPAG